MLELRNVGFSYRTRSGLGRHRVTRALEDVSFTVARGETLGIIGRNGCGKSTLLKILSGIYRPDQGAIERHCRNVSLLSLSVGFDQDLSGSRNLILSCMFLGYSRKEAAAKHDEIVEFSELGAFIDQPMRTYSSGMKARLGFSVGITMQCDVLLIDEVLGVGDNAFKQKATKALKDKINSDQSVVLVSHSLNNITAMCQRAIWLEDGRIQAGGDPEEVSAQYQEAVEKRRGVGNLSRSAARLAV